MIVNIGESIYDMPVELFNKTIELALEKNSSRYFIYCLVSSNVYVLVNDTLYFFYVSDDQTLVNQCLTDLKEFGFDFKKLKKVTNEEILNGILTNKHYFVIEGDYLIFTH